MKTVLSIILLALSLSAPAQWGLYQLHYSPDQDWAEFRWEVVYEGEIIASGGTGGGERRPTNLPTTVWNKLR